MTSASPKYGEGVLSIEQRNSLFKGRDRACLEALSRIYGDSLIKRDLDVEIEPDAIRRLIERRWLMLSAYAHAIHDSPPLITGGTGE